MKTFYIQITPQGVRPADEQDWDTMRGEYATNELIKCKTTHVSKVKLASVKQGNTLYACFKLVAASKGLPNMATGEQVKYNCKCGINFFDMNMVAVRPDGVVVFPVRSFAHDKLFGPERIKVVDQAFKWLAGVAECTVDELVAEAQALMVRR